MPYRLEGRMLEACSCNVICPCWVGEDPDGGRCDGTIAWHIERGAIDGVDVSGLTLAAVVQIPGNALKGNWRAQVFVDDRASPEQQEALVAVFSGQKGGPVADLAGLLGEVVGVERAPIQYRFQDGKGEFRIGEAVAAEIEPLRSAGGSPTALQDAAMSFIPGSPYLVGKTTAYRLDVPALGQARDLAGHSSVQGGFVFEA